MTASLKRGSGPYQWDEAGQIYAPDGSMIAQVSLNTDPKSREEIAMHIAQALGHAGERELAAFIGGPAEPSARRPAAVEPIEQRSLDSIIDQIGGALFPELIGCDPAGEPWRLARGRARKAIMLILGPLGRILIDQGWCAGWVASNAGALCSAALPGEIDAVLNHVLGPPGLEFAWPSGDVPSVGELGEMAVWLIGDAAATERAWREAGADQLQPDAWTFTMDRLNRQRQTAGMLRRLGTAALAQRRIAFERESLIGRALVEIREISKTPNDSPRLMARIHELAAAEVERIEAG